SPDAFASQVRAGGNNLLHLGAFVHGLQDLGRTRFNPHPDLDTARPTQRLRGSGADKVYPRLHFEGNGGIALLDFFGKALDPSGLEAEDIVGEPDVLDAILVFQNAHFMRDFARRAQREGVPINGLGAPVTVVGTAAAGNHVARKVSVRLVPSLLVWP